jgi:RND family efflux transporter MFP subunit
MTIRQRFTRTCTAALALAAVWGVGARAQAQSFDCIMEPAQKVKIGTAVTGVLAQVNVDRGDRVRKGDILAKLDLSVEEANLALAKAQALSNENIEAQKARLTLANQKLERATPLAAKNIVSTDKLEGVQADYEIAKRDLNSEVLKHHLAEIEAQRAQAALDLRIIRSPLSGLVADKHLSAGEFVNQENYILTLVQLDPLYIEAYLPVGYYGRINVGTEGTVHPAPPVGGTYKAPVTVVDHVFDAASGTFRVRLALSNPDNTLPGGERCRLDFDVPAPAPMAENAPDAPTDAEPPRPAASAQEPSPATPQ